MPPPGEIELREFCSPEPAHTCMVSLGAIASDPMDTTRWLSNTGRHVTPLLVDFQMPPAAAATNIVLDGDGIPVTSATRPCMFAGPMFLQRNPATVAESSSNDGGACAGACCGAVSRPSAETSERPGSVNLIWISGGGWRMSDGDQT